MANGRFSLRTLFLPCHHPANGWQCEKPKRPFPLLSPTNRQQLPTAGAERNRNGRSSPIPFLQLSNTTKPTAGIRRSHNGRLRPFTAVDVPPAKQ
ncbi:MAG: hypothetical protein IPJ94_26600 [Chloroflexi bacterium]|nr:hypothetical protein [Chloroflexota bacterium]